MQRKKEIGGKMSETIIIKGVKKGGIIYYGLKVNIMKKESIINTYYPDGRIFGKDIIVNKKEAKKLISILQEWVKKDE